MNVIRFVPLLAVLTIAACVSPLPNAAPTPGVVVAPSASAGVVVDAEGNIVPGAAIPAPGEPGGEPLPLPDTHPPLDPALPKSIETSGAKAPVISLVKTARASLKAGRPDQAGASLERALRIEPRNPWVWQALANLHVTVQQSEQAESEAKKAISLGKRNPYLEIESWRLIAEARRQRGDAAGAADAESHRDDLQRQIAP